MNDHWAWECISSCLEAFKKFNNQTKVHIVCSAAMKHGRLFGQFDASGLVDKYFFSLFLNLNQSDNGFSVYFK